MNTLTTLDQLETSMERVQSEMSQQGTTTVAAIKAMGVYFGSTTTAAATAEKAITCAAFDKLAGDKIIVMLSTANSASNPTFNVNNKGAAPVRYKGTAIDSTALVSGKPLLFYYDGTAFEYVGDLQSDFSGANGIAPGTSGLVPAPQASDSEKFLKGDGTWGTPAGGGSGGTSNYAQISKMNVTASTASPKTVNITLPSSRTFLYGTPNVLKFQSTQTGVLVTACNFNNGDATDFVYDSDFVTFDGVMSLKTTYEINVGVPAVLGSGYMATSAEIDMSDYKTVESIDISGESSVTLTMTATGGGKGTWTHAIASSAAILLDSDTGAAYDFDGNQLAANWASLTAAQKETAFGNASGSDPLTTAATLGTFQVLIYGTTSTAPTCTVTAIPNDQLILPQGLISLSSYEVIQQASVTDSTSGSAVSKQAVTPDLTNYYAYDTVNEEWVSVTATAAGILANGMTSTELAAVPAEAWTELTGNNETVGFAYALSMTASTETCNVDLITLTVDMKGTWVGAVHGTDYTFTYTSNTNLQVNLLSSGNWKINYDAGSSS